MFKTIRDYFNPHDIYRILKKAERSGHKRFLVVWNRGLGDVALGLYTFIKKIKEHIPDAEITFITRPDLLEAFYFLEGVMAIAVPWWKRGDRLRRLDAIDALKRLKMDADYDVIIEKIDPTKHLKEQIGRIVPRLIWKDFYDDLHKRFDDIFFIAKGKKIIGAHIETETQRFYGYKKDWDLEKWKTLFDMLKKGGFFIVLFGLEKKHGFENDRIIDLRGKTTLLECLSIIKNRCNVLLAPDSGILSLTYYIDSTFPIAVVSLWADSAQGVLKQAVASPNKGLKHMPIIGKDGDISRITPEEVYETIEAVFKETS
ncbi:MAG: hypothetical protein HZB79_04275 [Deltaproteobacteria bacterium]|nr:hypothetical protein [Deltaproteobacteria bacterium]